MGLLFRPRFVPLAICIAALQLVGQSARADEIRLKDGKKLYGVIVAYEENMFKVKTDFGYVLVEKDKIATIIPTTPAAEPSGAQTPGTAKNGTSEQTKPDASAQAKPDVASSTPTSQPTPTNASAKTVVSGNGKRDEKGGSKIAATPVKPELPAKTAAAEVPPPAIKTASVPGTSQTASAARSGSSGPAGQGSAVPLAAPAKPPEVPAIREEVQGNLYTNYTQGFRMFKAPSWQLIDDARNALPNAIVAMGTSNESTLMVVGREKTKDPLEAAAVTVEKRLHEVYENYRLISQKKATVGGSPAIEFHYIGKADDHDWSGTLVVIGRGTDIFTILGMTYADSDLIQIQENVIAKAIASLSFDVH